MAVKEGLLALLDDGPKHGYQLRADFESSTAGLWQLNGGQVYTTLDRLVRDGLVEPLAEEGDDPRQQPYGITATGRVELGHWWAATGDEEPPPRDELVLKVLMAIRTDHKRAHAVISRQRSALYRLLQERRRATSSTESAATLADQLALDSVLVRAEADLRWLDLCEQRIANIERQRLAPGKRGSR